MRLDEPECWRRLRAADHGVLGTVHEQRGVDLVPVVFAVVDTVVIVPVDTVKAKASGRLQRLVNLERDGRCSLLVEHYEADWSRLWWVRASGRAATTSPPSDDQAATLAHRHPDYRRPGSIASVIMLSVDAVTGWSA